MVAYSESSVDRRDVVRMFRTRLIEAMDKAELNRSALAGAIGVDRSTLSQLLARDGDRLPRADTVAAIASVLQVSVDWLLGMSHEAELGANILQESLQITPRTQVDEALALWHQEAAGYKIRYVPTTLPDLVKTEDVIQHEFRDFVVRTADQAIAASQRKLDYTGLPDTDMEVCLPLQAMRVFAQGNGVWEGLSATVRRDQIDHMAEIVEERYPSLRIFLFDGSTRFSVPYTIFGLKRAAIYVGQMYFVFNTSDHIRVLSRHFDDLIRAAEVQSNETAEFLRELRDQVPGD